VLSSETKEIAIQCIIPFADDLHKLQASQLPLVLALAYQRKILFDVAEYITAARYDLAQSVSEQLQEIILKNGAFL
jgi:hypothetical protein